MKEERLSTSMKRATVVFTDPEKGRTSVQEKKGQPSEKLRFSIRAAEKAFWEAYNSYGVPKS